MDIRKLDRTAVLETVRLVRQADPTHWDLPTPCAGWTLRLLVAHMTGQHHGFAAAAAGGGADLADWRPAETGDDPSAAYRDAAWTAIDAFARPGALTREYTLPEISTTVRFPATVAIGFHFLDHVVHGWDVARTLGVPLELDEATTEAALAFALRVPDDERRLVPDPLFRPALPPPPGASPLDLVLTSLGRSPDWSAAPAR
ncbi:TIGR03086 family metal-binding protein [Streptomyces parvulus]|uniref:TIGR03086 family protein n=1 Tax=Streptomyces parvulus TaxID=146923 RepID=A0A369V4S4_9ACTN|nr:TIGR03086 family metal-binding protein [Streptomyces parvulus]RDD87697.1 TIGR03086 family protein [Streptomyces parvulus]